MDTSSKSLSSPTYLHVYADILPIFACKYSNRIHMKSRWYCFTIELRWLLWRWLSPHDSFINWSNLLPTIQRICNTWSTVIVAIDSVHCYSWSSLTRPPSFPFSHGVLCHFQASWSSPLDQNWNRPVESFYSYLLLFLIQ